MNNNFLNSKRSTSRLGFVIKDNILPKPNRSQAHVEMILSFTIFMGVLIIIFVFLNPLSKTQEKNNDVEPAFKNFLNEISVNAGKLSVIVNSNDDCYNRPSQFGEKFIEVQDSLNSKKYVIYFSDYFEIGSISCSSRAKRNYTLGVYSEESLIIYEKIAELKAEYESDYDSLKQSLGIINDFSWNFKNLDGNEISQLSVSKEIPSGLNVQTKEISVIVMDKTGRFYEYVLNFKVW